MVFQNDILAGSSGGSGTSTAVHTIGQSIRFNPSDNTYMYRTQDTADNKRKLTFSWWMKRGSSLGTELCIFAGGASSRFMIRMHSDDKLTFRLTNGTTEKTMTTDMVFRDVSAWYHCVWTPDCTGSISSEYSKLYVNGARVTMTGTQPSANTDFAGYGDGSTMAISSNSHSLSSQEWDGYLAEMVLIDGQALDPSSFGLYNDSNIWIPRDVSSLSFGTNGFHLKGENASDLGNDSSSNNNDFTTSGLTSHDFMLDSPTNNFGVMNPLADYYANHTFKNGNLELLTSTTTSQYTYSINNIGMSSGKWYAEMYVGSIAGQCLIGISDRQSQGGTHYLGGQSYEYSYYSFNGQSINGGTQSSYGNTYTTGDIIGIALDLDNNKLYFSKNGTFQNSGDPTSGSTGTGAISITAVGSTQNGNYFFAVGDYSNSGQITVYWNFGQEGTFAGNTTAGGNSDSNGVGNFKYSVPSGYKALCTKNLGS